MPYRGRARGRSRTTEEDVASTVGPPPPPPGSFPETVRDQEMASLGRSVGSMALQAAPPPPPSFSDPPSVPSYVGGGARAASDESPENFSDLYTMRGGLVPRSALGELPFSFTFTGNRYTI